MRPNVIGAGLRAVIICCALGACSASVEESGGDVSSTSSSTAAPMTTAATTTTAAAVSIVAGDEFCDLASASFDEFNRVLTTAEEYRALQAWHRDVAAVAPPAVAEDLELVAAGLDDYIELQEAFEAGDITADEFLDAGEGLLDAEDDGLKDATARTAAILVERCGLGAGG